MIKENKKILFDEFISLISEESGIPKCKVKPVLKAIPTVITRMLKQGKSIKLMGFGTFYSKFFPAMDIVNPLNPTEFRHIEDRTKIVVDLSDVFENSLKEE